MHLRKKVFAFSSVTSTLFLPEEGNTFFLDEDSPCKNKNSIHTAGPHGRSVKTLKKTRKTHEKTH